jgi:hypothetical protein
MRKLLLSSVSSFILLLPTIAVQAAYTPSLTVNVRDVPGAKLNWNAQTKTGADNYSALVSAFAFACQQSYNLNSYPYGGVTVTDGGIAEATSKPIHITNCPGVHTNLNLHAIPGANWDEGISAGCNLPVIMPNNTSGPYQVIPNVWCPTTLGSKWPNSVVSSVTNNGGQFQLNLATPLTTVSSGQTVLVSAIGGLGVGSISTPLVQEWNNVQVLNSSAILLRGSTYSSGYTASGAIVWGAMPVGILDFGPGTYGMKDDNSILDCNGITYCVPVTDYEENSANFDAPLYLNNDYIYGFNHVGVFVAGIGTGIKINKAIITEGTYSNINSRTGFGIWFDGNTADSTIEGGDISFTQQAVFTGFNCNDIDIHGTHVYNGMGAQVGGPYYPTVALTYQGGGIISDMTIDAGELHIYSPSGAIPYVQLTGNLTELYRPGMLDAPLVLMTGCTTFACAGVTITNRVSFDPTQLNSYQVGADIGSWMYKPFAALEDSTGTIDSDVWNIQSLDQINFINQRSVTSSQYSFSSHPSQGSSTFTATVTNGSFSLTSVSIFPLIGTSITDNGGCLPGGSIVSFYVWTQGQIKLGPNTTPSCTNTNDTITLGSGQVYSGVTVTSGAVGFNLITNVPFPSLVNGDAISGTGIPSGSYLRGFKPFRPDQSGGNILFDNPQNAPATATNTAVTITDNPQAHCFQADEDGLTFFISAVSGNTYCFLPGLFAGWNIQLNLSAAYNVDLHPTSNGTNAATISNFPGDAIINSSLSQMVNVTAAGFNNTLGSRYSVSQAYIPPTVTSGFGTSPTIPATSDVGPSSFILVIGTGGTASTGVLALGPGANNGWNCSATDLTTQSTTVFQTKETAYGVGAATLTNYGTDGATHAWTAGDNLLVKCSQF